MEFLVQFFLSHFSNATTVFGVVFFLLALYFFSAPSSSSVSGREPPGPRPLPLLGNLLQIDLRRPYKTLCELSEKYGSVYTVYLGHKKVVVLAGYKTVKEALVGHAEVFGDREISPILYDVSRGHGILFANGDSWKEMRRFALSTLRDFGMGKRIVEEKILEECIYLNKMFENQEGKPFNPSCQLSYAASNIISSIVYGNRFEYDDPRFQKMVSRVKETISLSGSVTVHLYNMFPWLMKRTKDREHILKNVELNTNDMRDLIEQLKKTLDPETCRGLVDCFLIQKKKDEDSGVVNTNFTDENFIFTVANLFAAGTDTTATSLYWCLVLMAKYPHFQDLVQEELARVIGSREVRVDDRKNLPYTDAVIHETQRLANLAPMAIPHQTSRDITFQGFFLKKGTTVFPLLSSVLYDETEWESPNTFNPSHFLTKEGKFIKRDAFLPFSAGRRVCLGESLAKMELFLFFTFLLQRFRFTPPPGVSVDQIDLTPVVGFILSPPPQMLCAVPRREEKT